MAYQAKGDKRDIHAEVTATIVEMLEKGTAPWRKDWKETGAVDMGMPNNPFTGSNYSGINVVICWATQHAMGYQTSAWATYRQVQEAGGQVRKGEKGTHVVFFKPLKIQDRQTDEDKIVPLLRGYTVFNLEQCDAVQVPARRKIPEVERIENAETFIRNVGADLRHGGNRCYFNLGADYIQLPEAGQFQAVEGYYAANLHERTHWTGHEQRLNRIERRNRYGVDSYAFEELCAELGAAFICADLGINSDLENHASYLDGWLSVLKGDKKAIFRAAAEAAKAHKFLSEFQQKESKAA